MVRTITVTDAVNATTVEAAGAYMASQGLGLKSGDFLYPFGQLNQVENRTVSTSARFYAFPFWLFKPVTIDLVRMHLVTAQTNAEMMAGFYTSVDARPAALIVDIGTVDLSTGGGTDKDWSGFSNELSGWVWLIIAIKDVAAGVTVKGPSGFFALNVVPTTGDMLENDGWTSGLPRLRSDTAYPGSMPATAPTMNPTSSPSVPIPLVRAA